MTSSFSSSLLSSLIVIGGLLLFLCGFFPSGDLLAVVSDVDGRDHLDGGGVAASNVSGEKGGKGGGEYDKVVFVLIDALRKDFVLDPTSNMLFYHHLQHEHGEKGKIHLHRRAGKKREREIDTKSPPAPSSPSSPLSSSQNGGGEEVDESVVDVGFLLHRSHAMSPTVTMPRIKALLSGTIPTFLDLLLNFNSPTMKVDNMVWRGKERGAQQVFFGDDTWLRLFPPPSSLSSVPPLSPPLSPITSSGSANTQQTSDSEKGENSSEGMAKSEKKEEEEKEKGRDGRKKAEDGVEVREEDGRDSTKGGFWLRSEGTTSFFVADTDQVDANVTRHVVDEVERLSRSTQNGGKRREEKEGGGQYGDGKGKRGEEDVIAYYFHYLGLDHAGHLLGSTSNVMQQKKAEMDCLTYLLVHAVFGGSVGEGEGGKMEGDVMPNSCSWMEDENKRGKDVRSVTNADTFKYENEKELYRLQHALSSPSFSPVCGRDEKCMLVIASDHGMSESGNHGGSSEEETSAFLALFFSSSSSPSPSPPSFPSLHPSPPSSSSSSCPSHSTTQNGGSKHGDHTTYVESGEEVLKRLKLEVEERGSDVLPLLTPSVSKMMRDVMLDGNDNSGDGGILPPLKSEMEAMTASIGRSYQVDVSPTLCLLMGWGIPSHSIGTLLPRPLLSLPSTTAAHLLVANAVHLCDKMRGGASQAECDSEIEALQLALDEVHNTAGKSGGEGASQTSTITAIIMVCANKLQQKYAEKLAVAFSDYNTPFLILGVIVMMSGVGVGGKGVFKLSESRYIAKRSGKTTLQKWMQSACGIDFVLFAFLLAHCFALASTSMVEEEQTVVFYFAITSLFIYTVSNMYKNGMKREEHVRVFLLGAILRVSLVYHITGDKWKDVKGMVDTLRLPEKEIFLTVVITLSTSLLAVWEGREIAKRWKKRGWTEKWYHFLLLFPLLLSTFALVAYKTLVILPILSLVGITEVECVQTVYLSSLLSFVLSLILMVAEWRKSRKTTISDGFDRTILSFFQHGVLYPSVRVLTLLQRSWNIPLLHFFVFSSLFALPAVVRGAMIESSSGRMRLRLSSPLLSQWLSAAIHFGLGNFNSIASIDIAGAYAGLSTYSQGVVGLLTFTNLHAGHLVGTLLFVTAVGKAVLDTRWTRKGTGGQRQVQPNARLGDGERMEQNERSVGSTYSGGKEESIIGLQQAATSYADNVVYYFRFLLFARVFEMSVYCFCLFFLRHHLFIWSVLTPKLLFEISEFVYALLMWACAEVAVAVLSLPMSCLK